MKLFEKIKLNKEREIKILGFSIVQYGLKEEGRNKEQYFNLFPSKSFKERIFNKILKTLKNNNIDFDDAYICRLNMGETYVLSLIIKEWIKKNKSKKPIVILTQKYHCDIFELFCPDIQYFYIPFPKAEMDKTIFKIKNRFKNKQFLHWLPMCCNVKLAHEMKIKQVHFFDALCRFAKIKPIANKKTVSNVDLEINDIDISNFVLISPEALSLVPLSFSFWEKLTAKLKELGFDVIYNCKNPSDVPFGAKHCFLPIKQMYQLAQHAKAIISLRSGLNDVLSSINTKHFLIYTSLYYHSISSANTLMGYSLKNLPFVNEALIQEYDKELFQDDELIEKITEEIRKSEVL